MRNQSQLGYKSPKSGGQTVSSSSGDLESSALGFYAAAEVAPQAFPVAVSASFATFSPDEGTLGGVEGDFEHTVSVFDLLAGYRVYGDLAVGAGWASYTLDADLGPLGQVEQASSGFAVGAFGEIPLSDGIQVSGKLFYAPSANFKDGSDEQDVTMLGFSVRAEYEIDASFGVEAGYRSLQIKPEDIDESINTGGLFLGATYAF